MSYSMLYSDAEKKTICIALLRICANVSFIMVDDILVFFLIRLSRGALRYCSDGNEARPCVLV